MSIAMNWTCDKQYIECGCEIWNPTPNPDVYFRIERVTHSVLQGVVNMSGLSNNQAVALLELKIKSLHTALHDLQVEIESLHAASEVSNDGEIDFYDEVRNFEIYLIERALVQAKGVQKEAAKILKLRTSTLSQKIKLYNISPKYYAYQSADDNCREEKQRHKLSAAG
jgi:hypothetical protein